MSTSKDTAIIMTPNTEQTLITQYIALMCHVKFQMQ